MNLCVHHVFELVYLCSWLVNSLKSETQSIVNKFALRFIYSSHFIEFDDWQGPCSACFSEIHQLWITELWPGHTYKLTKIVLEVTYAAQDFCEEIEYKRIIWNWKWSAYEVLLTSIPRHSVELQFHPTKWDWHQIPRPSDFRSFLKHEFDKDNNCKTINYKSNQRIWKRRQNSSIPSAILDFKRSCAQSLTCVFLIVTPASWLADQIQ